MKSFILAGENSPISKELLQNTFYESIEEPNVIFGVIK